MSMSRARFNLLNRIGLLIVGCAILIFINIAAQPGHRRYGPYLARFNTPQAFISEWNQFAAFITVTHPAVVNFPKVWNLSDMVCIVASIQGGIGPTIVSDQDLSSQLNWDKDPTNALIFTVNDISAGALDLSQLSRDWDARQSVIAQHSAYNIQWLGLFPVFVYPGEVKNGLFCFDFLDAHETHKIPFDFMLQFTVSNVHLMYWPGYSFGYNTTSAANQFDLKRQPILDYLAALAREVPAVVSPMTNSQLQQRMSENNLVESF